MSQPERDARAEQDPLLEYVTEHQPQEAVVSEAVASAPEPRPALPDPLVALVARVDRLERSVERTAKQMRLLTSEVATIVNARRNNPAPAGSRGRLPAAIGMAAGLTAAVWFWFYPMNASTQPPPSPIETPAAAPVEAEVAEPASSAPMPAPQPEAPKRVAAPQATPARPVPARANPRPVAYLGTLSIDASPEAEVFINRRPAGRTPVRLTELKAGSHLVWIQREGFRRFTRVVQVPADRVTRVSATLDPLGPR